MNCKKKNQLPPEAYINKLYKNWKSDICLHPEAAKGICNHIISAHTIQRSKVLSQLIDSSNHVYTFYQTTNKLPRKIGWKEASTFTGFCGIHDNSTFEPIDNRLYENSNEQCFLMGYRALCHEIYQKMLSIHSTQVILEELRKSSSEEKMEYLQHFYEIMDDGAKRGLIEFQKMKTLMDDQLVKNYHQGWSKFVVKFSGDLCVASTGLVSVTRDLNGNILQELQNLDIDQQSLLYGMTCDGEIGYVVFVWPNNQNAPKNFIESIIERGEEKLSDILLQFMFAFVENTYFAPIWWDALSEEKKNHLTKLALMPPTETYFSDIPYKFEKFAHWKIIETSYSL